MTSKDRVLERERQRGRKDAQDLQKAANRMDGTALNRERGRIPHFKAAVARKNMLERKAGFVCLSPAGRVVRLLQPYDSDTYPQDPEELPAQWGFVWSRDPAHALPFVAMSTSPYNTGDCCSVDGEVYRARQDGMVWSPADYPQGWEALANSADLP